MVSFAEVPDAEVLTFREQFEGRSPLDELVRSGTQKMLQKAIEDEVQEFLSEHAQRVDDQGRRLVVRNGHVRSRELLTGAGPLEVRQPRVRDNTRDPDKRVRFTSSILPPYLRRSKSIDELIPWLYLKGISTGDFCEALQALLGKDAKGLSANVIVRLKEQWCQDEKRVLRPGDAVFLPPGTIHASFNTSDADAKLLAVLAPCIGHDNGYEVVEVADQSPWNCLR